MPSLLELALAYAKAGISIIPISPDGTLGPNGMRDMPLDCSEFISRRIATPDELRGWFADDRHFGLAAVLGPVSGGLECLDLTYSAVVKLFRQLVTLQGGADLLERLPAAQSPAEGRTRLYYRCPHPVKGYKRLAQLEVPSEPGVVRLQLVAFVHGKGSWTVLPDFPAAFGDSNEAYEWVGRDLSEAPTISEDERQLLLEGASCLNAWANPSIVYAPDGPDGFDSGVTWEKILVPLGWAQVKEFGEVALWHSPGRTRPGYCAITGIGLDRDLLYLVRTGEAYTKFGTFAWLYFDRDVEKARSAQLLPTATPRWETSTGKRYHSALRTTQPPLVSCILPTTGDRLRFLPQAIKCFQRQTYPKLELLILCDGEDDLFELVPHDDERIRYFYLGRDRRTLGTKLNLGCEKAKGDLMAHFDDDDWSHSERLSFQVGALHAEGAEVCAFSQLLFLEIASGLVWLNRTPALLHPSLYPGLPFGATYLYRRSYWSNLPFPDVSLDPDIIFTSAEGRRDRSTLVSDYRLYVAMVHGSNTANYSRKSSLWSPWPGDLREIMGSDLDFYQSLRENQNEPTGVKESQVRRRPPSSPPLEKGGLA
jgi:glycosyl transferase family 2/bifunctional DNA primase/polymerase-like protein